MTRLGRGNMGAEWATQQPFKTHDATAPANRTQRHCFSVKKRARALLAGQAGRARVGDAPGPGMPALGASPVRRRAEP